MTVSATINRLSQESELKLRVTVKIGSSLQELLVLYSENLPGMSVARKVREMAEDVDVNESLAKLNKENCGVKIISSGSDILGMTIYDYKKCPKAV